MPNPPSIQLERYFAAEPGAVWRSWTEAGRLGRWFGSDPAGEVLRVQLDVRPGGCFEVCFRDSSGAEHTCGGVYFVVKPDARLSFSWHWRSEPGSESFVDVRLTPRGAGTQMHFEHARLNSASIHDYAAGWSRTFEKLARALAVMP